MDYEFEVKPTRAYDLLTEVERDAVDEYIRYVVATQAQRRERIALALNYPIPAEFTRKSRGLLIKPLPRAALAERIREEANEQDLAPDRLIREYAAIAYAKIDDYVDQMPFGDITLKPFEQIPQEKMGAVKSMSSKPTMNGMQVEVKTHDKMVALAMLTKLMGLVAPDAPPVLEDYSSSNQEERQRLLEAPEELYARLLEG